jgi:hypothetical protein
MVMDAEGGTPRVPLWRRCAFVSEKAHHRQKSNVQQKRWGFQLATRFCRDRLSRDILAPPKFLGMLTETSILPTPSEKPLGRVF